MGKSAGGVRTLKTGSQEYNRRQQEVAAMIASEKYSSVEFSPNGGGYVAIEKSAAKHKSEEIEAAKILASKGYKVVLKNESGEAITPDGHLFSVSFEQRTPTNDSATTIRNALNHARHKSADIAVIYSKNHTFTRQAVKGGLKLYEDAHNRRFKQILIVADNGHIHRYKHNK